MTLLSLYPDHGNPETLTGNDTFLSDICRNVAQKCRSNIFTFYYSLTQRTLLALVRKTVGTVFVPKSA